MSSHTTFPQETDAHINVTSPSDVSGEVEYEEEEYDAYDDYEEEWETDAERVFRLGASIATPSADVAVAPSPRTVTLLHELFIIKYFRMGRRTAGNHIAALAARCAILELETQHEHDAIRFRLFSKLLAILKHKFADNYTFDGYARLVCAAARDFDAMSYPDIARTRAVLRTPFRVMVASPVLPSEVAEAVFFFSDFFQRYADELRSSHP